MKSPIKGNPLRNPGESIERELHKVIDGGVIPYILAALVMVVFAVVEWLRSFFDVPPMPWIYTVIAIITVALAIWRYRRFKGKIANLKLGREGEKAVGQYLELLRETGAKVFHDIPGEGFNLDHLVVHETGLYAIETKTLSKPDRGEAKLVYDGEQVLKNGYPMGRNAVTQVRAAKSWLNGIVKESTGKRFPIQAVVVYPGWFIEPTAEAKSSDVWVLNPKALPAFIENSKQKISKENTNLCAYHIGRYVRTSL